LVEARRLGGRVLRPDRIERSGRDDGRRQHAHQGAPLGGRRKRGDYANAIGRSRGGRTTKVHALTDDRGRPLALSLTPGQAHDLVGLGDILRRVPVPQRLIADRSYDARKLRDWLADRGCDVVIPPNPTRKNPFSWDKALYRARNVIERMFCRLKDFRRVATRYDKRADTYLSTVFIAATVIWWLN
jgi:transposase